MGIVIAAVAALAYFVYKNFDEIKAFWIGVWDSISSYFTAIRDKIGGTVTTSIRILLATMTLGLSEILIAVVKNWDAIRDKIKTVLTVIGSFL